MYHSAHDISSVVDKYGVQRPDQTMHVIWNLSLETIGVILIYFTVYSLHHHMVQKFIGKGKHVYV